MVVLNLFDRMALATKHDWPPGATKRSTPSKRLVAAELEARWNSALQKKQALENRLADFDRGNNQASVPSKELLLSLAQDLSAIWNLVSGKE